MANINLPEDQMQQIVSAAILQTVTAENRDILIKDAITRLITPESSGYGKKLSLLQIAFNNAIHAQAEKIIADTLDTDEQIKTLIKDIVTEAFDKAFNSEKRESLILSMASSIASSWQSTDNF